MDIAARERDSHLLGGRRVNMTDLLRAGLIEPETQLVFKRPRLGITYSATVLESGKLQLEDGRSYATPSRAAVAAAGGSLDGWHAWQTAPDGEFLDSLRQRLLDNASAAARDAGGEVGQAAHHEFLKEARRMAETSAPVQLSVRELMTRWGATGRSPAVAERIGADLENHGLTTTPDFLKVGLDSIVEIAERTAEDREPIETQFESDAPTIGEVGVTLGNIPSANNGVESCNPQSTFEEAITKLLLNDYSQLAVMTSPRTIKGAVTWQSIARERHVKPNASLNDAIIDVDVMRFDTELIDVLPILEQNDFVFVKDFKNTVTGIVTTADVVRAYGQLATPFFLIGELDQLLRRVISETFTVGQVAAACDQDGNRRLNSFDELTMGDYERVLQMDSNWSELGWPLDRVAFTTRLSTLREARNDVMHFNPDPVPEALVAQLRHMIRLLRKYGA
ncbi:MAG TPA: hypothetical protein VIW24_25905 [Aldersonia sp.]